MLNNASIFDGISSEVNNIMSDYSILSRYSKAAYDVTDGLGTGRVVKSFFEISKL